MTKLFKSSIGLTILCLFFLFSCGDSKKETKEEKTAAEKVVAVPDFNQDSAYRYVDEQVKFGPRVPGSVPHQQAADYLVNKFKSFGAKVQVQDFEATTFDNQTVPLKNIIASYSPERPKRILLAAHWDSRPFADKDSVRQFEAIAGANDGASGVGVLLEIARVMDSSEPAEVGVDIILFDGEDWGNDVDYQGEIALRDGLKSWWCLGSQYWSKNKHKSNYSAYYGILLDMVGGKNAKFHIEGYSKYFAPSIVEKVWDRAAKVGFSHYFVSRPGGTITDDHYFVNNVAKIPMINIIPMDPTDSTFGDFHHTHQDDMDIISRETLEAVGETVLNVIYYE